MTSVIETFFTIDKVFGPVEIKKKGSRFLSYLYPVKTKEDADIIIANLRKKYYDSTHVCFAYRLGNGKETYFRCKDDGEPSGTGGLPIYFEIKSKDYFNILAAVIRYFGGTKLGAGGLARAYGFATKKVLDISERVFVHVKQRVSVSFPFNFSGEIMHIVNLFSIDIVKQDYFENGISMILEIPVAGMDEVSKMVVDKSGGKIKLETVA